MRRSELKADITPHSLSAQLLGFFRLAIGFLELLKAEWAYT